MEAIRGHADPKHDLARILSNYADDFEISSPVIVKIIGEPSGTPKGKEAVMPIGTRPT